jgi:hypothetical protein
MILKNWYGKHELKIDKQIEFYAYLYLKSNLAISLKISIDLLARWMMKYIGMRKCYSKIKK